MLRSVSSISNLHYTRIITPKCVTSCGAHLLDLALGNTAPKKVAAMANHEHCFMLRKAYCFAIFSFTCFAK